MTLVNSPLFSHTANELAHNPRVAERDFWTCLLLGQLKKINAFRHVSMKGSLTLSKVHALTHRKSRDIDLGIDLGAPFLRGVGSPLDPGITKSQKHKRARKLEEESFKFVSSLIYPELRANLSAVLGNRYKWDLEFQETSNNPIVLFYFQDTQTSDVLRGHKENTEEKRRHIKLDLGPGSMPSPFILRSIGPYGQGQRPLIAQRESLVKDIRVLPAGRTFFEKMVGMHALRHSGKVRPYSSRHYYDVAMMARQGFLGRVTSATSALLEEVAHAMDILHRNSKASYKTAKVGTLQIVPTDELCNYLKNDYEHVVAPTIVGHRPSFELIMATIELLERHISPKEPKLIMPLSFMAART